MPWKETWKMDEKMQFIGEYLAEEDSLAGLCRRYEISRKTGYKWIERYEENGPGGLSERSRAPKNPANAVGENIVEAIISARLQHPTWGPKKLLVWLMNRNPQLQLPSNSTAGRILKRYGLTKQRKVRRRVEPYTKPFGRCCAPNETWCADFKGDFKTTDGWRCYPLTITDAYSRYILTCHGISGPRFEDTKALFEKAFKEYGLPKAIRSDNGSPFATKGPRGLSRLSIWWLKLGIKHERIQPGHPEQNGRHERMHRTLKDETAKPPKKSQRAQQRAFNKFRKEFNKERPHEALGQKTPTSVYCPSTRAYFKPRAVFSYPPQYKCKVVHGSGRIRWAGNRLIHIGRALAYETIGLKAEADSLWHVFLGELSLGVIDSRRLDMGLIRNKK